jgi:hypothetical protein
MKYYCILSIYTFLLSFSTYSQNNLTLICKGIVIDSSDNNRLTFATIYVKGASNEKVKGFLRFSWIF